MALHWLGVDTGGTFTDFVYFSDGEIRIHKVLSTPEAPEKAILQGIDDLCISIVDLQLIHGSTVATNAVLEASGVKTVYISNKGFADVLTIGRQARKELYNLMPEPKEPLIKAAHCLEINTRLNAEGQLIHALRQDDIKVLIDQLKQIKPDSVAINLLFSFLDERQEHAIEKQLKQALPDLFVSCSCDVLPEYKEYERGMATALNSYIGPLMQGYLARLQKHLKKQQSTDSAFSLAIMQSNGGTIQADHAGKYAVNLLLSGPAGGLKGAQVIAGLSGESKILSFDMGGTSTDVALIEGEIKLTSEGFIGDYPVAVPMVDMHTIGAGGGSIAYVDAGGLLHVGPESAGAAPGPACYQQGGIKPTVTDANLVLGRLSAGICLGEDVQLSLPAARTAVKQVADKLAISVEAAAAGIIQIANEHMARALRKISIQRGFDPLNFSLTCFGGAGGLHVCALADALNMKKALVPIHGGVLSALGMLVSSPSRDLSHACIQLLTDVDFKILEKKFNELVTRGIKDMQDELVSEPVVKRSVDLRYEGQSFTLNLNWLDDFGADNLTLLEKNFHKAHKATYGHQLDMPVELVNLRINIKADIPILDFPKIKNTTQPAIATQSACYGFDKTVPVYQRGELMREQEIAGPALIMEAVSTTLIDEGWLCVVDESGNLILRMYK